MKKKIFFFLLFIFSYTWRSIYADDETANLIVEDYNTKHCTINDADTAINLSNNVEYDITECRFTDNYMGIYLYNYMNGVNTKSTTGNIFGNQFTSNGTTSLNIPTSGIALAYGISGITLNYTEDLTIGKESSNTNSANTFSKLYGGIKSYNANFHAYHNKFDDMKSYNAAIPSNCIETYSENDANDRTIVIGNGIATGLNTFDNSGNGISMIGQQNIDINDNYFGVTNRLTNIGTFIMGNDDKLIRIRNNNFKDYFIGTFMAKIYSNATVSIDSNTYTDANLTNTSDYYYGTAIEVVNKVLGTRDDKLFTITNNIITNPRLGIVVGNMDKISIGTVNNPNTITYPFTSAAGISDYYLGVWMQHCSNMRVVGNTIANSGTVISGTTLFRGIENETSTDGRINCNTITNMPYSMNFYGNCDGTLLRNNSMSEYDEAIHLDKATLPDQYQVNDATSDEEPMHNVWNDAITGSGNSTDRVTGTISGVNPIEWYSQSGTSGSNSFDPLDGGMISFIINITTDAAGTVACDDFSNRQSREERFGAVVGDTLHFDEDQNENAYFAKSIALKAMDVNIQLLSQGNANDADYMDFYNAMKQSNIGMFDSINNLTTDTNEISNAIAINASINDTNTIEYYKKIVLDIYLNTAAQNIPLSENDTAVCDFISSLSYFTAGEAIYIATGLIGKEIHPSSSLGMRIAQPVALNRKNEIVADYSIMPNPVHSSFILTGEIENLSEIYLMSSNGKILKQFKPLQFKYAVTDIANGMYWLKLVNSSGKVSVIKLSIIK